MATKRRGGLGRGLDKLIPNKSAFSDSANDYGDLHLRSHDLSKYRRQL